MSTDGTRTPDPDGQPAQPAGQPDYGQPAAQPDYGQPAAQPDYGQANPYGQSNPYGEVNPYGQQAGYGAPVPTGPIEQPSSIRTAVLLMRIGALLSLLSLLSALLFRDDMHAAVLDAMRKTDPNVSSATVDTAVAVGIGLAVFGGLVGVALWLWMASANGKGRSWARIMATVLFAISVLFTLIGLAQPQAGLQRLISVVSLILGAVIIFLLWKRESSAYYNAASAPQVRY